MKFSSLFSTLLCASTALAGNSPHNLNVFTKAKPVHERRVANEPFKNPEIQKRASSFFLTDKTKPFAVNGTGIPEVNFDVGESYAGLLPISDDPAETRKLFFWFFPSTQAQRPEEIVIWLNGGPGCSSLSGFLTVCLLAYRCRNLVLIIYSGKRSLHVGVGHTCSSAKSLFMEQLDQRAVG